MRMTAYGRQQSTHPSRWQRSEAVIHEASPSAISRLSVPARYRELGVSLESETCVAGTQKTNSENGASS